MNWVLLDFKKAAYRQGACAPPQKKPQKPPKNQKTKILFFGGKDPRSIFGKLIMCSY